MSDYTRTLLSENSRNLGGFWAAIKHVFPSKAKNVKYDKSFVINGIKSTKPNEIANGFCNNFSTAVSTLRQISYTLIDFTWKKPLNQPILTYKLFHFWYVSVIEVTQLLKKSKRKKAAGYDDLPLGLLNDSATVTSAPLTHIINLLFRSGVFPSDSKIVKIWPLYKNGATVQFGNYRPISILPVISKVPDKIIRNRLVDYLSESKLLSKRQFGFRARRSTELAITLLCDNFCKNVDSKQLTGCVFIDFSKAFDTVSDVKLLQKLNAFRIRNIELGCFQITYLIANS